MKKATPQYQQSSPSQGQSTSITIHNHLVPIVEYQGQRVVTLAMIDEVHERVEGTAGRNFREHRHRLREGKHFFELTADEIRRQSLGKVFPARTAKGVILTEVGYLLLVKAFTDDLAWEVQEQLVDSYFVKPPLPSADLSRLELLQMALQSEQERLQLEATVEEQAIKIDALQSLFKEGMSPAEFCKGLNGVNVMQVCNHLESRGWLFNESKTGVRWRVASYARDRYMTEHQQKITPHGHEPFIRHTPILLRKGAVRLFELYLKDELPMKKTWDGQFSHDKALAAQLGQQQEWGTAE